MRVAHDDLRHKGFFATQALIAERFWWLHMHADICWFVQTCHLCQLCQLHQIRIPPVVATPAPLFAKVYIDTMLWKESVHVLGNWIYEDMVCRWGSLSEIVTDNGAAFLKATVHLSKKYHIYHIHILGYNLCANGLVERPHFDVRQSLFKAVDGDEKRWSTGAYSVFWAERVTIRR